MGGWAIDRNPLHIRVRDLFVQPVYDRLDRIGGRLERIHADVFRESHRYSDPRCLTRHGYRCFSQNDEDGIIDEIFQRIGSTTRTFVEFGVENGTENNTLALLTAGWRGTWIEASAAHAARIRNQFRDAIAEGKLTFVQEFVSVSNVEALFVAAGVPGDLDLLSIDIDRNDYWVWQAVRSFRPRVVVIEYNASLGRSARAVVPYDPVATWDGSSYFGASLAALEALGREKGYALVGCNVTGVNAFFVRADCVRDHFLAPYTAAVHYEPPRYGPTGAGHPVRWGTYVYV